MTTIAWTGETWNPIRATDPSTGKVGWYCRKVSAGCFNCYAQTWNRFRGNGRKYDVRGGEGLEIAIDTDSLMKPISWTKAKKIFVCSMTDLFLDEHADEMIAQVFAVMGLAQWHTFQVLTKRPERMRRLLTDPAFILAVDVWIHRLHLRLSDQQRARVAQSSRADDDVEGYRPLPNVWLGVSAEDQERFDERVGELLQTPAAVRWVSHEPALEQLDIIGKDTQQSAVHPYMDDAKLDWIVVGGESGRGARAFDPEWANAILTQCHGTPCKVFVKQMGSVIAKRDGYADSKGEDPLEWPEHLRVREYPEVSR